MKAIYWAAAIIIFISDGISARGQSIQHIDIGMESLRVTKEVQTATDFKLVKQNMSNQNVLRIQVDSLSKPQTECVYKDITFTDKGSNELEFYLKIVSPRGVVRVEARQFDSATGIYNVVSQKEVSNKDRYVPYNWIRYQLYIPPSYNSGQNTYRIVFYFNQDPAGSNTPISLLHGESVYFLTDVRQAGYHIFNGRMDEWDIDSWPATPKGWSIAKGEGYLERGRGHLMDDECMVIINKEGDVLQVVPEEYISTLDKRKLVFYARADRKGQKVEFEFKHSKKVHRFTLHKKWNKYVFTLDPMKQDKPTFYLKGEGRIYIDELMLL